MEENIYTILLSAVVFFLPFILGHPQILVGTLVNAMLILGATYLHGYKLLPVILLPSIGVLTAGLMFGTYTLYLLYLIPLIWLGNVLYAYSYKHFNIVDHSLKNNFLGVGVASIVKAGFLFATTFILVQLAMVPTMFLTVMGLLQLATAVLGGILAVGIIKAREWMIG